MARITKAQLEAQVASLQAQLEQAQYALLQLEAARTEEAKRADANRELFEHARDNWRAERDAAEALRAEQQAARTPSRRVAAAMPQWQQDRAAQMAAARALAMRVGRAVKVEVAA